MSQWRRHRSGKLWSKEQPLLLYVHLKRLTGHVIVGSAVFANLEQLPVGKHIGAPQSTSRANFNQKITEYDYGTG